MAVFLGWGQNDSGGPAQPVIGETGLILPGIVTPLSFLNAPVLPMPKGIKATGTGVLYQTSGSVYTGGTGQIFPTGRT